MHLQTFSLLLQRMWQKDSTSLLYGLFGEKFSTTLTWQCILLQRWSSL
jgi:hypothetical protein